MLGSSRHTASSTEIDSGLAARATLQHTCTHKQPLATHKQPLALQRLRLSDERRASESAWDPAHSESLCFRPFLPFLDFFSLARLLLLAFAAGLGHTMQLASAAHAHMDKTSVTNRDKLGKS